jgi:two-component system, chemotaxis family, chemotaxis protein CheY
LVDRTQVPARLSSDRRSIARQNGVGRICGKIAPTSLRTYVDIRSQGAVLCREVVRVCKTGLEAVTAYPTVRPNLVLMDITMPDMDGVEATKRIIAADAHAKVIMVTSHGQQAMVVHSLEAGACGYVLKPVAKEKLAAMIDRALKSTPRADSRPRVWV